MKDEQRYNKLTRLYQLRRKSISEEENLEKSRKWRTDNGAGDQYITITASPEFREVERLCEKARHDEAQALLLDRNKGRVERNFEIVRNLLAMDIPLVRLLRKRA